MDAAPRAKRKLIFGDQDSIDYVQRASSLRGLQWMHHVYGSTPQMHCHTCVYFEPRISGSGGYTCRRYGLDTGMRHAFFMGDVACGLFTDKPGSDVKPNPFGED